MLGQRTTHPITTHPMSGLAEAFTENDEAIKHLLRQVVYMFYPHQAIIIMEALLFHNVLFEDDLIKLCCMHKKVFRSFCNKLLEDKLVVQHTQKEETQPYKLYSRTYFYIHNIEAIDSIKWKIHTIVKKVKEEIGNFNEPSGYICPSCHSKYSLLDAASMLSDDKLNFECSICNDYLVEDDISQEQKKGQEKLEKLMSLLEPIIKYLKIVDDLKIDDNNFESTLMKYVPAFSDSLALYSVSNRNGSSHSRRRNKDNDDANETNNKSQATIHVSITADDEDLKRERQKREDRNRKLRQNALPSWHQESTVGKESLGRLDSEEEDNSPLTVKSEFDSSTAVNGTGVDSSISTPNGGMNGGTLVEPVAVKVEESMGHSSNSNHSFNATTSSNSLSIATSNKNLRPSSSVNVSSNGTTVEELDALSAYYSQLRQRQAVEQEEEDEADELEADGMGEDFDLDDMDVFNDNENDNEDDKAAPGTDNGDSSGRANEDIETQEKKNGSNLQDTAAASTGAGSASAGANKTTSAAINEDIDEDDFDLDMFASDEE